MATYHLAQVNIGRVRDAIDSPLLADFVAALDPVNQLADESPGFVWRLQTEDGDATAIRPYDDDSILVNMSVWESLERWAFSFTAAPTRQSCVNAGSGSTTWTSIWLSGGSRQGRCPA
jgi:Domain of unknown function (DUF3291)